MTRIFKFILILLLSTSVLAYKPPYDFKDTLKLAESGNAAAQFRVGKIMMHRGWGNNPATRKKAIAWLKRSVEQDYADAQDYLAMLYERGKRVNQSYSEAIRLWRKAAEQGHANALFNLGRMYQQGHGVKQDIKEARKWFTTAAKKGSAEAQLNLGMLYQTGQGAAQDYTTAYMWFYIAATNGSHSAKIKRGTLKAKLDSEQLLLAKKMAKKWAGENWVNKKFEVTKKQAEQGDAESQSKLGAMYYSGQDIIQDYDLAFKWSRKAAEQGVADAQSRLGVMYSKAQGISLDNKEAVKWYRKAAEQGDVPAQSNLGWMHARGKGVPQSYKEAVKWYVKATEQGNQNGIILEYFAGKNSHDGRKVPQDYVKAYISFSIVRKLCQIAQSRFSSENRFIPGKPIPPNLLNMAITRPYCMLVSSPNKMKKIKEKLNAKQLAEIEKMEKEWAEPDNAKPDQEDDWDLSDEEFDGL